MAMRLESKGLKDVDKVFKVFAVVFAAGVILLAISCFLFVGLSAGITMVVLVALFVYAFYQGYLYVVNEFTVEAKWERINLIIGLVITVLATFYSLFSDDVKSFEGVTLSTFVLLAIIWFFAIL